MADRGFIHFTVDGVAADTFRVVHLRGREEISQVFRFDLEVAVEGDVAFAQVLGQPCSLRIDAEEGVRWVRGMVRRLQEASRSERFTIYGVTMVPPIWTLSLRRDTRVFQSGGGASNNVPNVVKAVLRGAGIPDASLKEDLSEPHAEWEYCTQYRETDLDFVSRLMEQEGIFYFFEHTEKKCVLRIADNASVHSATPGVEKLPHRPGRGMRNIEVSVTSFRLTEEMRSNASAVTDYNFKTPSVDLSERLKNGDGEYEYYDHPGEYDEQSEGRALAKLRLEDLRATAVSGEGTTSCRLLLPGFCLEMEEHPQKACNGKFLVLSVEHEGSQPQSLEEEGMAVEPFYEARFSCIPAATPYRPPRVTPRPSAQGVQTAVVVGPSGQEVYADPYGRVRVQFHWDRIGHRDQESSCAIRVAQLWAGKGWGALFTPRIGQEVIVEFIDSDPDQPLIIGAVYNQANMPPYNPEVEGTVSTLKTNSSLGGGGFNEFRFEDAKDKEEVYLHAQKNLVLKVLNDEHDTIDANRTTSVGKNETVDIGDNRTETVNKNETISIGKNRTETVSGDEQVTVDGTRQETIKKKDTLDVQDDRQVNVGKSLTEHVEKNCTTTVGEKFSIDVGKSYTLVAQDQITLRTGSAELIMKKNGDILVNGTKINLKASGEVQIKGSKVATN